MDKCEAHVRHLKRIASTLKADGHPLVAKRILEAAECFSGVIEMAGALEVSTVLLRDYAEHLWDGWRGDQKFRHKRRIAQNIVLIETASGREWKGKEASDDE